MREKIEGGGGRTASSERMIRDRETAAFNCVSGVLTRMLATSQAASSEATTETMTPRAESNPPSMLRWTRRNSNEPTKRARPLSATAIPSMVAKATTVRAVDVWKPRTVTEASRAPSARPTQNPP